MSKFVKDIKNAAHEGRLKQPFRAADVKMACHGWAENIYTIFYLKRLPNSSKTEENERQTML